MPTTLSSSAVTVIVAAHNEERGIGRLLDALTSGAAVGEVKITVVCNGCSDRTADVARSFAPWVEVIELPEPSKRKAQRAGDAVSAGFPRAYVDGDVVLGIDDLRKLAAPLRAGTALATAPARSLRIADANWVVSRYYAAWQRLPQVREGLFGRGVVMVSREGADRILGLPDVLSDDLAMSEAFSPEERQIVEDAVVHISVPRRTRDLIRRRVRVATGNTQADQLGLRHQRSATSVGTLARLAWSAPGSIPDFAIFLLVTLVARTLSRRRIRAGDYDTWLRDESSRDSPLT